MSRASTRRRSRTDAPTARGLPLTPFLVGGLLVVAFVTAILVVTGGGSNVDELGDPQVSGEFLPEFDPAVPDGAVGAIAPTVEGADFAGDPVTIGADGEAKLIIFLAHWCSHCRAEVPVVTEWLATDPLPEGVAMYAVATSIDDRRENYPPSAWLQREEWPSPVLRDSEINLVASAFGLDAFPYWVFIDADGAVVGRTSGELTAQQLDAVVAAIAP